MLARAEDAPPPAAAEPAAQAGAADAADAADAGARPDGRDSGGIPALSPEARDAAAAGMAAFRSGDFGSAAMRFRRMLALAPEHPVALVNLATAEYQLGNAAEAEQLLRKSLRIKPDAPEVWSKLGIILLTDGRPRAALAALARATELEPRNPRARNYLGTTLAELGWLQGAEAELRRAIELDEGYAEAHFNLALVYLQRNPPPLELARRHYRESLRLGGGPDQLVERRLAGNPPAPAEEAAE